MMNSIAAASVSSTPQPSVIARLQRRARRRLLEVVTSPAEIVTAWVSGSLVENLGNKGSDVDIFVLVEDLSPTLPATRRDPDHVTLAFVSTDQRYDVEFWSRLAVEALAAKLSSIRSDDPAVNTNHSLSYWESEFVHRLAVGRQVIHAGTFARTRAIFAFKQFSIYLFENGLRRFDDAFDDTVGMLADGQLPCAALRAREVVGLAIDALLYASGDTNDKAKFRPAKLHRLASMFPAYRRYEEALWRFEAGVPLTPAKQEAYAQNALRFAADLAGELQDRLYNVQWRHVYGGGHNRPRLASIL
jgi:hypothetical protein